MAREGKSPKRADRGKTPRRSFARRLKTALLVFLLLVAAIAGLYRIAGPDTRSKMEHLAISAINPLREIEALPGPLSTILNLAYDAIPASTGFSVDGASLPETDGHVLGGIPESDRPVLVLRNERYTNLFDESGKQSRCLAFRLSARVSTDSALPGPRPDPRVPRLQPGDLNMGPWVAGSILPRGILLPESEDAETPDTSPPVTAYFPLEPEFIETRWNRLLRTVARQYPGRFDEVWVLTGPVVKPDSSKLSTGVYVPDGFYLIVLDRLPDGGIRALSFILPVDRESARLSDYLSNLATIEKYTKLRFLPELEGESARALRRYVAPKLW